MIYYFQLIVGATTKVYVPLSNDSSFRGLPYLQEIGDIERKINADGTMEMTEFTVTIHDEDRWLRGIVAAKTELKGCLCQIVCDYCTFNGIVYDWNIGKNLSFTLVIRDLLSHYLDNNFPIIKLNKNVGTPGYMQYLPDENVGESYIYPFGIMSSGPYKDPHGCYDCPCIDGRGLISGINYNDYMVSAVPIESIDAVYREENGAWVKLTSAQWSIVGGYAPIVAIRVIPQAFVANDTLKEITTAGDNHIHVNKIGRWRVGCCIKIGADTTSIYTITGNDNIDKLDINTPIVNPAAIGDEVKQEPDTTLSLATVVGEDHCHINKIGTFDIGTKITIGDTSTIYTVTGFPGGAVMQVSPNIVSVVANGQAVHFHGDSGAMPGLEKIRVDVHGIYVAGHESNHTLTNPADIRYYFLKELCGIPIGNFDRTSSYPMIGGTWGSIWNYCNANNIKIAGCINVIKPAKEWDIAMGFSSMVDTYISRTGLIQIRIYSQTVAPVDHELAVERDTIGDGNPYSVDRSEIWNDITAKYCYNGNDYYAKATNPSTLSLFSIARKGSLPKELSFDFQWDEFSMKWVIFIIYNRYAFEKKIFNSATRLLYNNHATPAILDLNDKLYISSTDQIDIGSYYRVEKISQNSQTGEMALYCVSTQ